MFKFQVTEAVLKAAVAAEVGRQLGSDLVTADKCEVTITQGRKSATNPNPELKANVVFHPNGIPAQAEEEKAPAAEEASEVGVDVAEEAAKEDNAGDLF